MSKIFLSLLTLSLLAACDKQNPDFVTLEKVFVQPGVEVIGMGLFDTVFIRIPATPEVLAIAAHGKNSTFWSDLESETIARYVKEGTCLINAKMDYAGNCPYRLYCGNMVELKAAMSVNTMYSTEICK